MSLALVIGGFDISWAALAKGLIEGLTYGLLAAGLVLVYRSSRFINFAQISIGLFGASALSLLVGRYGFPYWVALVVAMFIAAGVAAATEVVVVRPLRSAPKVLAMVATLGMASFLFFAALAINGEGLQAARFPEPSPWFFDTFDVGALQVRPYASAQILSVVLLLGLGAFLRFSRYGVAIRGAASNPDAAALAGVSPSGMSLLSWSLAGAVSCFAAVLLIPSKGAITPESIGPDLLLRALAAAAIARFRSIPVAVVSACGIGIVQQVLATKGSGSAGLAELVIFVAVVIAILATPRTGRAPSEPWGDLGDDGRLPAAYRRVRSIRRLPVIGAVVVFAAAASVPLLVENSRALAATQVLAVAIVGVSVVVITGMGGQLSLGQFAIGGIGATAALIVTDNGGNFFLGLLAAVLAGGVVSALIGIPALRVQGLLLAVATLAFALVCTGWLLKQPWMLGNGRTSRRPDIGLLDGDARNYYYVALLALALVMLAVANLRRGAFGRKLVAVRDNEDAARALTVNATAVKLQAYVLAGMIAGLGGAIYAQSFDRVSFDNLGVQLSIDVVIMAVVGGIGSLWGPVIGALYLRGVPSFFDVTNNEALATISAAWLVLLTYQFNGVMGLVRAFSRKVQDLLARFAGLDPMVARAPAAAEVDVLAEDSTAPSRLSLAPRAGGPVPARMVVGASGELEPAVLLDVRSLTKRFGAVTAVEDVSFVVHQGETLGLIGPNGAGKTTLFELVTGFVRPDAGLVGFNGLDMTPLPPHRRAELGMVRSFQAATLFPTLTLLETVMVAKERAVPSRIVESVSGSPSRERARNESARALVELFGLTEQAGTPVAALPTGTRRLVELACTVAMEPQLILLDEPSAGVAQAETEQLGQVLRAIRNAYGITFVVIEHDLPLLTGLCDRLVAMEVGRVIATGTPQEVQNDPAVIESYVGGNTVAVARSGVAVG